jgi:uncharacterized protein with PIN domain
MLSVLADENFSHRILRGIRLRAGNIDVLIAQNVGLGRSKDAALLRWAAEQRRIVLTHDRQTIPKHAYERVRARQPMPGVIVVSDTMPIGEAVEALTVCLECGAVEDFENLVTFLP